MRRLLLLAALALLATLAATGPAAAKGPSTASITGPGLAHGLPVKGQGEGGPGTPLGSLVQLGGFFPQVFRETPDPTTRARPRADLGPRYQILYRVPGLTGKSTIVQDVYPYAKPRPVTHMRAGQRIWSVDRTHGGWFVSNAGLKATLVDLGLPASPPPPPSPPTAPRGGKFPWAWTIAGVVAVVLSGLVLGRRSLSRSRTLRTMA
jgi:hypothetical protein